MKASQAGMRSAFAAAALVATAPAIAQPSLGITATQNGAGFREQVGMTLTFVCPATDGAKATIYGTDIYTDDSMICAAAIHAGVLKARRAGVVSIVMDKGAKEFRGSERNGVASRSYGAWGYSYSFVREPASGTIAWRTIWDPWNQIPRDFTEPVLVTCPEGGETKSPVWGTDIYQKDSSICVAAVHAGVISPSSGGVVAVSLVPGPQKEFAASERFRVASRNWSAQPVAFAVAPATSAAPPTSNPSAPPPVNPPAPTPGIPARAITLVGFVGVGSASQAGPIPPRSIALTGFTGIGSASQSGPIQPRTIAVAGFSGVGSAP